MLRIWPALFRSFVNRTWLALMTVALVGILPRLPRNDGNVSLPFNLGEVAPVWFHSVVFSILVVLTITFATAHIQQVRAQKLAHSVLDSMVSPALSQGDIHPRELFDMCRLPTFTRVAPLPQSLRGKYQFFAGSRACPPWLRLLSVVYYAMLKLVSFVVYFGLPGWALFRAYCNASLATGLHFVFAIGGCLAGATLLQVAVIDARYAANILSYLWAQTEER